MHFFTPSPVFCLIISSSYFLFGDAGTENKEKGRNSFCAMFGMANICKETLTLYAKQDEI